jgi:hypothetical protein
MRDPDQSLRRKQFRIFLLILAPLLLGFSLVGIIDGDIFQAISWAVVVLIAVGWLLMHRPLAETGRSGHGQQ